MREFCQNIEPYRQPSPSRNPGGDCFACALTAGMRWLFRDAPALLEKLTFDYCFDRFSVETVTPGRFCTSNTWPGMQQALKSISHNLVRLDVMPEIVLPIYELDSWSHPWFRGGIGSNYYRRLEAYLRAGWIVFTETNLAGTGPVNSEGKWHVNDHFILLDGVRESWQRRSYTYEGQEKFCGALIVEIHVVCSARGAYWMDMDELLNKHGTAGWILARPAVSSEGLQL